MMTPSEMSASSAADRQPRRPLVPAERVTGTNVFNPEGEKIGFVDDIAIDKISGQVAYAILSVGGWLGIGDRHHPVPWGMLNYDVDKRGYVIPMDKDQLEKAPSFDSSELSGWDDQNRRDDIYTYYAPFGVSPYWI